MPTPYQHLLSAVTTLESPALPGTIRARLTAERGAFLLGSIAADVRYLTHRLRTETHFHEVPPADVWAPIRAVLRAYPELATPARLASDRAAFVSGYLLHLIWDARWALDIFCPYYKNGGRWSGWGAAMLHHNALRLMLDRRAFATLPAVDVAVVLRSAAPDRWVPFIADEALREWRDRIADHLSGPQDVEGAALVFAERMGVSLKRLLNVTQAIERRAAEVHVPGLFDALERFGRRAPADSLRALRWYWDAQGRE